MSCTYLADKDSGLHVAVDDDLVEGVESEGVLAMASEELQNAKMAYLGGTIQMFDKGGRQHFVFPVRGKT